MLRSERKTALVGVRFSRRSNDRGGQAPALRYPRRYPFTVGRGPVPRHAAIYPMILIIILTDLLVFVKVILADDDREGQALALRAIKTPRGIGRSRGTGPRATMKKKRLRTTTIARDRPSRYGEKNASRDRTIARDRPSRYEYRGRLRTRNTKKSAGGKRPKGRHPRTNI